MELLGRSAGRIPDVPRANSHIGKASPVLGRSARRAGPKQSALDVIRARARALRGVATIAACLVMLGGCASATSTPIASIDPLVGKWSGTVQVGRGFQDLFYLTVNADRSIVAQWGMNWSWGNITLQDGRASYQMSPPPLEGTIRFYQGTGRSEMYLDDLFASFNAYVTKDQ